MASVVHRNDSLRKMTTSQGSLFDELQEVSWYQPGVPRSALSVFHLLVDLPCLVRFLTSIGLVGCSSHRSRALRSMVRMDAEFVNFRFGAVVREGEGE